MSWKIPFVFEKAQALLTGFGGLGMVGQSLVHLPFGRLLEASEVVEDGHPDISCV